MLMDEPFGALDPITRSHLQDEFLRILHALRKTIVFVTHDIDEAIKMGDRIAVMRDGHLLQYATPEQILAAPADPFIESFVGSNRVLKRLSLLKCGDVMTPLTSAPSADRIHVATDLRTALAHMLERGIDSVVVTDGQNAIGIVDLALIRSYARGAKRDQRINVRS
jgi:osmoprotectant transport system ATP-binding protein